MSKVYEEFTMIYADRRKGATIKITNVGCDLYTKDLYLQVWYDNKEVGIFNVTSLYKELTAALERHNALGDDNET